MKTFGKQLGFSPIIIAVAVALILIISGAGYYFVVRETPEEKKAREEKEAAKAVDELRVEAPAFDLSLSPLPSLNSSALNVSSPNLPASGIFPNFSVNSDFSYGGSTAISSPTVKLDYTPPAPKQEQSGGQQEQQQDGGQQQSQSQVNQANCAQFSSIPSSQYCYMSGAGQSLCEQCKAAGY